MAALIHLLLSLLASIVGQELAQQVSNLKASDQILRSKLPDRITLSNWDRRRLGEHSQNLRVRIEESILIAKQPASLYTRTLR